VNGDASPPGLFNKMVPRQKSLLFQYLWKSSVPVEVGDDGSGVRERGVEKGGSGGRGGGREGEEGEDNAAGCGRSSHGFFANY
jgi:hypothetical protein